ncbi:hypothetical protein EQH57_0444 [Dictyocoela roeselum]|nr:hypothetical protein EQH57_0444 [Dictyocoela roeselum]
MTKYFQKDNVHFFIPTASYIIALELSELIENKRNYIFDARCPIYDDIEARSIPGNLNLQAYATQQRVSIDIESPFSQRGVNFPKRLLLMILLALMVPDKKVNLRIISFVDNVDFELFMADFVAFMGVVGLIGDGDVKVSGGRVVFKDIVVCDSNF